MATTNDMQNSLCTAIDTIVERRIEQLELDKTVVASIEQCVNSLTRQYRVQYKGGSMLAYAQSDESYTPNTSVYVSIPRNDFSAKKWIIGRVSETTGDHAITEVSAALEDFQIMGQNLVSSKEGEEFGLLSYMHENGKQVDVLELYNRNKTNNLIKLDQDKMQTYMKETKALFLEASFRTNLNLKQQRAEGAEYGLAVTAVFESADSAYQTFEEKFNSIAPKIVLELENGDVISLLSLDEDVKFYVSLGADYTLLATSNAVAIKEKLPHIQAQVVSLSAYYQESELEYGLLTQYSQMLKDMVISLDSNRPDWYTHYTALFASSPKTLIPKEITYSLYSGKMIGQPFQFFSAEEQYDIFSVDSKHFKYIDKIIFYCYGFNPGLNMSEEELQTANKDIFVRDIELYCLQELSSVNGDYKLRMKFPQGQIFDEPEVEEDGTPVHQQMSIETEFLYKNDILTNGVRYFWFVKDGRVTSANHKDYHLRGGVGWRYFEKAETEDSLTISAKANTAYENIYKCVAVYQETIVLKSEFKIYNESNHRIIEIESNLGTKFKFDNGVPVLTCKILDKKMLGDELVSVPDYHNEYYYHYVWMRQQQNGQVIVYDKTYEELLEEYNEAPMSVKLTMQSQLTEMEGIVVDRNVLTYPVYKIKANEYVTFDCYVYRSKEGEEEKFLGTGSITLKNDLNAIPSEYHIVIENGDQVFQYTESGVSPCNERIQDPQKIKDLICHFYDLNGLEVNSDLYKVTWKYPVSNSLIIPPETLQLNPSNNLVQLYREQTAPFTIQDVYDYSALDNKITCIVEYNDIKVDKDTNFYFGKIGDNGTNGTDLIAKIEPVDTYGRIDNEPLTLVTTNNELPQWNTGVGVGNPVLSLKVFNRNELIDENTYKGTKWRVAGTVNSSNAMSVSTDSQLSYLGVITPEVNESRKSNYLVRAETNIVTPATELKDEQKQTVYAFYPICFIDYALGSYRINNKFSIDKDRTLKQILYNADGRNPMYNKNQGVFFSFSDNPGNYIVSWTAKGGATKEEKDAAFSLFYDNEEEISSYIPNAPYVYIKPKDVYGGECQNNYVEAKIYLKKTYEIVHIATAKIPIYISLNRYGLASLNAWDGNTIEINEDQNYIMAPQIGAGEKNEKNQFTGIVMGTATTYDLEESQVGLLGYSEGRQSIFLDAKTGNATFGLPEQDERNANGISEDSYEEGSQGRIELRPGGLSSIAKWKFNSRMLFNIPKAIDDILKVPELPEYPTDENLSEEEKQRIYEAKLDQYNIDKDNYDKAKQNYETWGGLGERYSDLSNDYRKSIPHNKEGILFSSDPAYISVKGKPLTLDDKIAFNEAGSLVKPGDTFELEINPNLSSLFTIYKHTTGAYNEDMEVTRLPEEAGVERHYIVRKKIEIPGIESSNEGNQTYYSRAIYSSEESREEKDIVAWQVLNSEEVEDGNKEYFVAIKMPLDKGDENDPEKWNWVIKTFRSKDLSEDSNEKSVWDKWLEDESARTVYIDEFENWKYWYRSPKVGIDNQGRFYTNSLKNTSSALNIDNIGAFGRPASEGSYIGASFEVGKDASDTKSLIKMFCLTGGADKAYLGKPENPVYISGGSGLENEYERPMYLYGKEIGLYGDDKSNKMTTNHSVRIGENLAFIGHEKHEEYSNEKNAYLALYPQNQDEEIEEDENGNPIIKKERQQSRLHVTDSFTVQVGDTSLYSYEDDSNLLFKGKSFCVSVGEGSVIQRAAGDCITNLTGEKSKIEFFNTNKNFGLKFDFDNNNNFQFLLGQNKSTEKADWFNPTLTGGKTFIHDYAATLYAKEEDIAGTKFETRKGGTVLSSNKRIGIYTKEQIDITSLGNKSISIFCKTKEIGDYCYLQMAPTLSESLALKSKHGKLCFKSEAVSANYTNTGNSGLALRDGITTNVPICAPAMTLGAGFGGNASDNYYYAGLISKGRIYCESAILSNGAFIQGKSFQFDSAKKYTYNGVTYSKDTVEEHISQLYTLLGNLRSYIDGEVSGLASASALSKYVEKSDFNGHKHNLGINEVSATNSEQGHTHSYWRFDSVNSDGVMLVSGVPRAQL